MPIKTKVFDMPNPKDTSELDAWLENNPSIQWVGSETPWPGVIVIFYKEQ